MTDQDRVDINANSMLGETVMRISVAKALFSCFATQVHSRHLILKLGWGEGALHIFGFI
jgi:hypothetical protein